MIGSSFDDILFGDFGANVLYGGDGADFIRGEDILRKIGSPLPSTRFAGDDTIYGGAGEDLIYGDADAGVVESIPNGTSTTTIFGGDDTLYGGADNDTIYGDGVAMARFANRATTMNGGNDQLFGDAGNDVLYGDGKTNLSFREGGTVVVNGGDDTLDGGTGNDVLWGDAEVFRLVPTPTVTTINGGADTFVFGPGGEADQIMDFRQSEGDRIDVSGHGITDVSGLTIEADTSNTSNTVIDFGDGDMVTLVGFGDESALGAGDFIFAVV